MGSSSSTIPGQSVVTIDGPPATGKSTVAAKLAKRLGFIHLNSGALFRAVGLRAHELKISFSDAAALVDLARSMGFEFQILPDGTTDFLVGGVSWRERVTRREAGDYASQIATVPELRAELVTVQHHTAEQAKRIPTGLVLEGRDSGTVVFPNARWKFYLDAPSSVRAERRWKELDAKARASGGSSPVLAEIQLELEARDLRDRTRAAAPQVKPEDAELIDTSHYSVDEVVEVIARKVESSVS